MFLYRKHISIFGTFEKSELILINELILTFRKFQKSIYVFYIKTLLEMKKIVFGQIRKILGLKSLRFSQPRGQGEPGAFNN